MKAAQLATLKFFALLFLLPGLAGLIVSAMVSTHYLETLPNLPDTLDTVPPHTDPQAMRVVPRNIHGTVVYQTARENHELNLLEYGSAGVFVVGLGLGLVFMEKWGSMQEPADEESIEFAKSQS